MNLSELKGTQTISGRKINDVKTTICSINKKLQAFESITIMSGKKIDFSAKKITISTRRFEDSNTLFRIYKEGSIVVEKQNDELKISWTVKLETLYALAFSIGVVSLIFSSFIIEFPFALFIGVVVCLAVLFMGIIIIMQAMDELISTSALEK